MYEVELKFPLGVPDSVIGGIEALGGVRSDPISQRDTYLAHPVRDFGETDEAFRVRVTDDVSRVTYKGPVVDALTKTRREIEISFQDGRADELLELFALLGFHPVRTVSKVRTAFHFDWEGHAVEATIDVVEGLGTFCEIEATAASESDIPAIRDAILRLADRLDLSAAERRSYLVLLLERDTPES